MRIKVDEYLKREDEGEMSTSVFLYENGTTATDRVTGFKGVIVGRCDYLTGCRQYLLQPSGTATDKKPDPHWFDEERLLADPTVAKIKIGTQREGTGQSNGPDLEPPKK
jgi:hypothetical protein